MCLIKQHWLPRFSFKDKVVYKIIIARNNDYRTPFLSIKINLGQVLYAKRHWFFTLFKKSIEGEGVHAYCDKTKALYRSKMSWDEIVIKCIIPKFTFYWLGYDREIASTKLLTTNQFCK